MITQIELIEKIKSFVSQQPKKTWTPGVDVVQYAGPWFDENEYAAAINSLLNGWLVLGRDAQKFEHKFPKKFAKDYGLLVNSGSSANLIQMNALKSKKLWNFPLGTKVLIPIAGFPTTLNPVLQVGFKPIFVDIEIRSLNLDLDQVEAALEDNPDCKVITFAHVLGNPPDMDRLKQIIDRYKLVLLEDCCDALASTYRDQPLGSWGEMVSCSFYPAHHITAGEGGFVACSTSEQERVVRSFREWGRGCYCVGQKAGLLQRGTCGCRFNTWVPAMPDQIFDHKYVYDEIGYNLKPIELQASMLLAQLDKLPEITRLRKQNHALLMKAFSHYADFFHLPVATPHSDPNWFAFAVTIKNTKLFNRWEIVNFFETAKIQTRPYFAGNIMLQPAYEHLVNQKNIAAQFPVATKVMQDTFFLGTSPVISLEQIDYIASTLKKFMDSKL